MKKISFALFFCLCALAGFAQNSKPLDLKEIVSGEFIPQNISGVIPIPGDGEHYSQMNADKTQIIKYSFKTGKPEDGSRNEVLNGIPDWVYEEEFAFNRALEFSPDSKMLAFIRFDEREVPSYTFPVFAGEVPHIAPYEKYPGEYTYK